MKSTNPNKPRRSFPAVALASGCAVLALWPGWSAELRAQTYSRPLSSLGAVGSINNILRSNFSFDRPTTQASQNRNRMRQLEEFSKSSDDPALSSLSGGAAGADQYKLSGDNGLFFSAGGSFGDFNTKQGVAGFDIFRRNVSLGLDHRFTDKITTGLFFNYLSTSANIAQDLGNFQSDTYRFIPYVSLVPFDNAYVDISAGYGYQQNRSNTNSIFGTNTVSDKFGGAEYFGSVDFGKTFNFDSWTVTPYGQASAFGMNIEKFLANVDGEAAIVGKQYPLSVTTTLGVETSYAWSTSYGVVIPRIFGEWVHEYKNNSQIIDTQLQVSGLTIDADSSAPIRNRANVGIGAQMVFPHSLSAFVNYQSLVVSGATNHLAEGGLKWEF